ncbi:MAG: hypothetical protein ABSE97_01425 [Verrucomicrobiota bacterium]|jgi:hypothetical protein
MKICEFIEKVLPFVVGALTSGLVGVCLFFLKRKRDAKDSFLVFISQQRIRVEAIRDSRFFTKDFQQFHAKSRQELTDAVARVWPFLNRCSKSRIKDLWTKYDQISPDKLDSKWEQEGGVYVALYEKFSEKGAPPKPSTILLHYLREFEDVAK